MQTLTEVERQFEHAIVGHKHDDVACGVKDRGADFASRQMALNLCAHLGVERVVNVLGNVVPDVAAVRKS